MSSIEEKRAKIKAIREKKKRNEEKKAKELKQKLIDQGKLNPEDELNNPLRNGTQSIKNEELGQKIKRDLCNYVGTFTIAPKSKSYMYDQGVNVTREEIDSTLRLAQEEEAPIFDAFSDNSDEYDNINTEEEKNGFQDLFLKKEEAEKIMKSDTFQKFIRKGSIELDEAFNSSFTLLDDVLENENPEIAPDLREKLSFLHTIKDDSQLENYQCVGVSWCRSSANLILAIYNCPDQVEYQGKIAIWNIDNLREPVHILQSMKRINRAQFDISDEKIVYAALVSGQIMQFDMTNIGTEQQVASGSITTKPSLDAHVLPIFCLEQITDGKMDKLLTISYEGKMCIRNKETISEVERSEVFQFKKERAGTTDDSETIAIAPTISCVYGRFGGSNYRLYVATHDNIIQEYMIENLFIDQDELRKNRTIHAHDAPICSISMKSNPNNPELDGMLLSGSFDFSIALCVPKKYTEVIHKMQYHEDYVTGVDWNPEHPAMFASCDCSGKLCLWNLLEDKDYPVYITKRDPISQVKWHPDGLKLVISLLNGEVEVWKLKKKWLAVIEEELLEFEKFIAGEK